MSQEFRYSRGLALEVQLAWEVMTCRAMRSTYDANDHPCQWFNQHYGPYPAYDWIQDLPAPAGSEEDETSPVKARCVGERFQVPELMSGCRKAPIMTIGINPNLTAYYPSVDGGTWCYPYFDNIGQYAHYFRHRAVCQERFTLDFIKENVVPGTAVEAEKDGKLVNTEISSETGGINLRLSYENEPDTTLRLAPGYKVFAGPYDRGGFSKGDIIAGKVALNIGAETTLIREPVGYYKRFQRIFEYFKKSAGLEDAPLCMGEDVCQADMVACASPGWGKWFTDYARDGITEECVHKRKWLILQLLQTAPRVIVFSGMSAFSMFYGLMKDYIHTELDLFSDTYEVLKKCVTEKIVLEIELGEGVPSIECRIAISPHFSYSDNFKPQSRFTYREWEQYESQYPEAFKKLNGIVRDNYSGTRKLVFMTGKYAPTEEDVGTGVWKILQEHLYEAEDLIARVIKDEYENDRLEMAGEHFKRTDGPCKFCVNELYEFKEGCPYGKTSIDRANYSAGIVGAAQRIIDGESGR